MRQGGSGGGGGWRRRAVNEIQFTSRNKKRGRDMARFQKWRRGMVEVEKVEEEEDEEGTGEGKTDSLVDKYEGKEEGMLTRRWEYSDEMTRERERWSQGVITEGQGW